MISEKRSELVRIAAFSVDTLSDGNFCVFQTAFWASSVKIRRGLGSGEQGILFFLKKVINLSLMITSRYCLAKGPT